MKPTTVEGIARIRATTYFRSSRWVYLITINIIALFRTQLAIMIMQIGTIKNTTINSDATRPTCMWMYLTTRKIYTLFPTQHTAWWVFLLALVKKTVTPYGPVF